MITIKKGFGVAVFIKAVYIMLYSILYGYIVLSGILLYLAVNVLKFHLLTLNSHSSNIICYHGSH